MRKLFPVLFFVTMACAGQKTESQAPVAEKNYFGQADGCFLLYNVKTQKFEKIIGEERCKQQIPACSTFKVPLAVIAFDSGVLKNTDEVLKWNGKKDVREVANKDHNAKTWMSDSIVWFSQRITKQLGQKKTQNYLDKLNYGNKDLSGGLTQAWLVSPSSTGPALKISAYEQVEFMKKLWSNELPVSAQAMQTTREITYLETSEKGYRLHGKTGSGFYDKERKMHLGWFIAHIQKGDQEYISVANFGDPKPVEVQGYGGFRAKDTTKAILTDLGLW